MRGKIRQARYSTVRRRWLAEIWHGRHGAGSHGEVSRGHEGYGMAGQARKEEAYCGRERWSTVGQAWLGADGEVGSGQDGSSRPSMEGEVGPGQLGSGMAGEDREAWRDEVGQAR